MSGNPITETGWLAKVDRHGPALVALGMALVSAAYLADAASASTRLHNLLLLVPLVGFVIIMAAAVIAMHYRAGAPEVEVEEADGELHRAPLSSGAIALMMVSLLLYAFLAPYIGFDVASALFIAFCLYIQGERRIVFVLLYSVLFAAATTWSLAYIAGAAVPTLFI